MSAPALDEARGRGASGPRPRRPPGGRRGRRLLVAVGAVLLAGAVAAAGVAVAGRSAGADGDVAAGTVATATVPIARRTLVDTERLDGTLGWADPVILASRLQGTVTWLAPERRMIRRGQVLYKVDNRPVVLMDGRVPAWRTLAAGVDGPDVVQLEANLRALGDDPDHDMDIDQKWDWATTAAVKRWQHDLGEERTGRVELGQVVFLPAPIRVNEHKAKLGGPAGEILEVTSTTKVVTVKLDADKQGLVRAGHKVRIQLPDGRQTGGKVSAVGTIARTGSDSDDTAKLDLTITLDNPRAGGNLDQAPVTVLLTRGSATALAVPVNALLALAGGGYAVEVDQGGTRRLVKVQTGVFADGLVQISGAGLRGGTRVVVPR